MYTYSEMDCFPSRALKPRTEHLAPFPSLSPCFVFSQLFQMTHGHVTRNYKYAEKAGKGKETDNRNMEWTYRGRRIYNTWKRSIGMIDNGQDHRLEYGKCNLEWRQYIMICRLIYVKWWLGGFRARGSAKARKKQISLETEYFQCQTLRKWKVERIELYHLRLKTESHCFNNRKTFGQ
jgi:hypothetical protein